MGYIYYDIVISYFSDESYGSTAGWFTGFSLATCKYGTIGRFTAGPCLGFLRGSFLVFEGHLVGT
jgi:hypothetical protein